MEDISIYNKIKKVFLKIEPNYILKQDKIIIQCFKDVMDGDIKEYCVYKINIINEVFVLKKTDKNELFIYETFLEGNNLPVPKLLGHAVEDDEQWILLEYIKGSDLKRFDEESALKTAESLSEIFNKYWIEEKFDENNLDDNFNKYYSKIKKRSEALKRYKKLEDAYKIFIKRQFKCPRTLCNGDLLPINVLNYNEKVVVIDWEHAAIMPYSLDIARLIGHGSNDGQTPFYITDELRETFIKRLYENLNLKTLTYEQYVFDIKLAILNECIEFLQYNFNNPNIEKGCYYDYHFNYANVIADEILSYYDTDL